jgi:hypothetical protein
MAQPNDMMSTFADFNFDHQQDQLCQLKPFVLTITKLKWTTRQEDTKGARMEGAREATRIKRKS